MRESAVPLSSKPRFFLSLLGLVAAVVTVAVTLLAVSRWRERQALQALVAAVRLPKAETEHPGGGTSYDLSPIDDALREIDRLGVWSAAARLLEPLVNDSDYNTSWQATETLGKIVHESPGDIVPILNDALRSQNGLVRSAAANALGELGPEAASSVPNLVRVVANRHLQGRYEATNALSRIGSAARDAVPVLRNLVNEEGAEFGLRAMAHRALQRIDPEAASQVASPEPPQFPNPWPERVAVHLPDSEERGRTYPRSRSSPRHAQVSAAGQAEPNGKVSVEQ